MSPLGMNAFAGPVISRRMVDVRRPLAVPETYAVLIAGWYAVLLTLGIPTLPAWAHVVAALAFIAFLCCAAVATARLDNRDVRRTAVVLGAGFVSGAAVVSLVTATTAMTVKQVMKTTFVGRVLVALVGACLFVGVVVALVTGVRVVVGLVRPT